MHNYNPEDNAQSKFNFAQFRFRWNFSGKNQKVTNIDSTWAYVDEDHRDYKYILNDQSNIGFCLEGKDHLVGRRGR